LQRGDARVRALRRALADAGAEVTVAAERLLARSAAPSSATSAIREPGRR